MSAHDTPEVGSGEAGPCVVGHPCALHPPVSAHDTPEVGSGGSARGRCRTCGWAKGHAPSCNVLTPSQERFIDDVAALLSPEAAEVLGQVRDGDTTRIRELMDADPLPASPDPVQPAEAGEGLDAPPPAAVDVEHDIWWGYLCPALANIGALKDAQQEFVALGTDWTEAGRILSRVQRFYVDAAHDAARRYDAAREAAWAEKYAAVVGERDEWKKAAWDALAPDHNCGHKAALATALREKAEDRARVEAVAESIAYEHAATIDGEFGCCHDEDALRAGGRVTEFDGDEFEPIPDDCPGKKTLDRHLDALRAALAIPTATGDE